MTSYLGSVDILQGDLPREEASRGGSREWTAETSEAIRQQYQHVALANSGRQDDFVALKNAALRRIKENKRRQTVVLPSEGDSGVVVYNAKRLDRKVTQSIMEKVMEQEPDATDDIAILKRLRKRLAAVDLSPPTITVRYRDVNVTGKVIVASRALPNLAASVSSRLQPAMTKFGSSRANPPQRHVIIDSASGILRPGRFTLLLGAPQSGKTTFLRTLAGLTRSTPGLKLSYSELTYNGMSFDEFVAERSAAYVSQVDLHYGELTVRETLDFSARVQGAGHRRTIFEELAVREDAAGITPDPSLDAFVKSLISGGKHTLITELALKLLRLEHASGTVVGNAMLRGISGGERKRLTTGEIIVGPARVIFADEISTGLDSNTTFEIVKALRDVCHVLQATLLVGLLQPAPETFELFDDVILLAAGKVVYHGPKEAIEPFFQDLNFQIPLNRGVADFLQEVAVPTEQEKYWAEETKAWRYITPRSMQHAFLASDVWHSVQQELDHPIQKPASGSGRLGLADTKYGASKATLVRAVASRAWILQKRTKIFAFIRTFQVLLMALVLASAFWREDKNTIDDGNFFMGVLFYSLLYQLLGGISEMHVLCDGLPVFHKQRAMHFYPGWSFAVPTFFLRVPFCFIEATLWTNIVYWLVGFDPSPRFLMFWLIMFLINVWSVLLFQLIAAVCRDDTISTAFGSFFLLIFINISGFVINTDSVPAWWLQGLWPNPFFWAMRALAINEFTSGNWDKPDPANPSSTLGADVLEFRGFPDDYWWCWAAVGFIIATGILNFGLFVAALSFLGPFKRRIVLTPEALEEHAAAGRLSSAAPPKVSVEALQPRPRATQNNNEDKKAPSSSVSNSAVADIPVRAGSPAHASIPGAPAATTTNATTTTAPETTDAFFPSFSSSGSPSSPHRRGSVPASERLSFSEQAAQNYRQRTAIPFIPVVLTFRHVEYSVPLPPDTEAGPDEVPQSGPHTGQLRLLQNIDGVFRPFVLTALMGATGSGKTTLMDVLAGRKTGGKITGDMRVNGHPKEIKSKTFAKISGYVEQTDIHLPQASVEEALAFSALLRLPTTVDAATRNRFVKEMLELVELDRISNAFVGVPGVSGLSVEQRKRLTLAVELVANPSIVFLDEPTSGLDARAAGVVISAIRNTVNSGRTVVCTIHQPSYDIFEAFDELLLLRPGGRVVYNGPLGDGAKNLVEYLQALPGVKPLPPRHNPANWMLEVTSPAGEEALNIDFADAYARSDVARSNLEVIKQYEQPEAGSQPLLMEEMHVAPFKTQFKANFIRFWRMYWRAPEYNLTRLVVTLGIAFVFGSLFWRQGNDTTTVTGVLNIAGVLFSSCLFLGIMNCLTVQHTVALQREVMYRERAAGYYKILPFALAQQAVELPYLAVQTVLFSSIVYWMVYFAVDAGKFFLFMLFFYLTLLYFVIFGMFAVALTPVVALANVFCSFFFGFWNLFCGFLIPQPAMPVYYKYWIYWMNPVTWSLYSLAISQLGDLDDQDIKSFDGQVMPVPEFLAQRFNWHRYMMWPSVPILLGFTALFSVLTYVALKKINYQRR